MSTTTMTGCVAAALAEVARIARSKVERLSPNERQHLKDIERGRHQFIALERLVHICARSQDDAIALAVSEALRALALATRPPQSLDDCDDAETDAQCEADKAIARVRRNRHDIGARYYLHDAALRESESARRLADCALIGA